MGTDSRTFLGVDGGQTGTRAVVVGADGGVLCRAQAGGTIHALAPGGEPVLREALTAIRDRVRAAGCDPDVVFLGLTGVVPGTASEPIGVAVAADVWPSSIRIVEGDGIIAWAGATGGAPGVAATAGTGSVVVAINERGDRAETGGWGYLFGDQGSGWHIGSDAIRLMLRQWDRTRSITAVGRTILERTAAATVPEVPDRVSAADLDHRDVARLAEPIIALARRGDEEAAGIVAGAAADFAVDVAAAVDRLDWEEEPVLVGVLGKIFRAGPVYRDPFLAALQGLTARRVRLADPVLTGLGGAVLLAMRAGGIAPTPALIETLVRQGMGGSDA